MNHEYSPPHAIPVPGPYLFLGNGCEKPLIAIVQHNSNSRVCRNAVIFYRMEGIKQSGFPIPANIALLYGRFVQLVAYFDPFISWADRWHWRTRRNSFISVEPLGYGFRVRGAAGAVGQPEFRGGGNGSGNGAVGHDTEPGRNGNLCGHGNELSGHVGAEQLRHGYVAADRAASDADRPQCNGDGRDENRPQL